MGTARLEGDPRGRTRTSWRDFIPHLVLGRFRIPQKEAGKHCWGGTLIPFVSLHVLFPEKVIDISPCQRKSEGIPASAP